MGWRTALYGNEAPSKRRRYTVHAVLIIALVLVFGTVQTFVATPEWHQVGLWVTGIV